jgi:putative membrane protein
VSRHTDAAGRVFDAGLQPERTFLAWQRTVLALGVACAAGVRYVTEVAGLAAVFAGVAGLGLAIAAYVGARLRYRRAHDELVRTGSLHSTSAWALAALSASAFMLALLALALLFR